LLAGHLRQNALRGQSAAKVVAEQTAGYESDDHHHADDDQDAAQHDFLDGARLLQKSKHVERTPGRLAEWMIINQPPAQAAAGATPPSFRSAALAAECAPNLRSSATVQPRKFPAQGPPLTSAGRICCNR